MRAAIVFFVLGLCPPLLAAQESVPASAQSAADAHRSAVRRAGPAHVRVEFVLRRAPGPLYDLSSFDPSRARSAIRPVDASSLRDVRTIPLARDDKAPNTYVCRGRQCEPGQR